LKRYLVITHGGEPPSSELAKAAAYIVNQWTALRRFVENGRLSLDNNLCEQQLRAIALAAGTSFFAAHTKRRYALPSA
jgi:transposase